MSDVFPLKEIEVSRVQMAGSGGSGTLMFICIGSILQAVHDQRLDFLEA